MIGTVNGTQTIIKFLDAENKSKKKKGGRNMKNYMKTMVEKYFVKNQVVLNHVGNEGQAAEMLKRNSYALLNVSPRFF